MVNVDNSLRVAEVILHIITVCGGLMTGIGLGWTVTIFSENCLLYADMALVQTADRNQSLHIDSELTNWGTVEVCYYCVFSSVVAAIYAIIWFWFYLLLSDWDNSLDFKNNFINFTRFSMMMETNKKRPPDLRLFVPTLLLLTVLLINTMVSLGLLTRGSNVWCDGVEQSLGKQCSYVGQVTWEIKDGQSVYRYMRIAQAGSWVLLLSIFTKMVIVSTRIHLFYGTEQHLQEKNNRTEELSDNEQDTNIDSMQLVQIRHNVQSHPRGETSPPQSYQKTSDSSLVKRLPSSSTSESANSPEKLSEKTKLSPQTVKKYYSM